VVDPNHHPLLVSIAIHELGRKDHHHKDMIQASTPKIPRWWKRNPVGQAPAEEKVVEIYHYFLTNGGYITIPGGDHYGFFKHQQYH